MWSFLKIVEKTSFCCLKGQQMAPLLMGDVWPDVVHQSTAMLLFMSGEMVSERIANAAQLDVLTALQWGILCVMVCFVVLAGAGSVRGRMGAEMVLGLPVSRLLV
jgi:hypothetical protein